MEHATRRGPTAERRSLSRRTVLGAGAGAIAATAGCVRHARSVLSRDGSSRVSVTVKVPPADDDPRAIRIARRLAGRLESVGIATKVLPMARESLRRDVLLDQSFDVYVARSPGYHDPDFLRSLLHSRFAVEPGWQNPFGYAELDMDELLERQRVQRGATRRGTLADIQRRVVRDRPLNVVAFPDEIRAVRTDRYTGWGARDVHTPLGYLSLEPLVGAGADMEARKRRNLPDASPYEPARQGTASSEGLLRMALTDSRPTESLNPIAVEQRDGSAITGLLYDPVGRWLDGAVRPWLAETWTWREDDGGAPVAEVELHPELGWHDGTPLTAADLAFTYRFLADTALGELPSPVPSPRFRGRSSLVDDVTVVDERTASVRFVPSSRSVAVRAFTVPVLPAHVWAEKTGTADVAGFDVGDGVTKALVWANRDPVGSGALRFEAATAQERLALVRNDEHFLERSPERLPEHLRQFAGGFSPERLVFTVAPSGGAAVALVRDGAADATASAVMPADVPAIGRSGALELVVDPARGFYHVGFNTRRTPLSNPRFRRGVAQLIDEVAIAEEVFEGFATPAVSPLARSGPPAPRPIEPDAEVALPFPGDDEGDLAVERARQAFRAAGYRYDDEGALYTD